MQGKGFNSFASNMIKLSVNETKWSSLLARTRALTLYISIWKFNFGPETLPGLSGETDPSSSPASFVLPGGLGRVPVFARKRGYSGHFSKVLGSQNSLTGLRNRCFKQQKENRLVITKKNNEPNQKLTEIVVYQGEFNNNMIS